MRKEETAYKVLLLKLMERDWFGDTDRRVILQVTFKSTFLTSYYEF